MEQRPFLLWAALGSLGSLGQKIKLKAQGGHG